MCVVAELRAVDLSSSHQFEEEIGAASSENGLFIAKMEFSVRTGVKDADERARIEEIFFPSRSRDFSTLHFELADLVHPFDSHVLSFSVACRSPKLCM
jgi:hypothetical protein